MLTTEQQTAFDGILLSKKKVQTLGGLAGSGKTTLVSEIAKQVPVSIITPTWKAALVLHKKGFPSATTIHDFLLAPSRDKDGKLQFVEDTEKTEGANMENGLLVIDEASMVTAYQYKVITENWGGKILFVGDHGQLPPIGGDFSVMANPDYRLEQIHRQAAGSPIIDLAHRVRQGLPIEHSQMGDENNGYVIGKEAFDYALCNINDYQVITATNRDRTIINMQSTIGKNIKNGDRIIILDNIPRQRCYNGMILTAMDDLPPKENLHWLPVFDGVEVRQIPVNSHNVMREVGVNRFDLAKKMGIDRDRLGVGIDFAYALTAHKMQGSSAKNIAILNEGRRDKRWLYTAITRAENLVIVDRI